MFRIFWQVWIGEIGKKDYQIAKRIKKTNSKWWNLWRILDFKRLYFFKKTFHDFPKTLIKSVIHKLKKIKISRIFWQLQIDEIENKMSKIIKKIKKQIVNCKILKNKYFTYQYFF